MQPVIDMVGKRFGKLEVIERDSKRPRCTVRWLCRCDCGTVKSVDGASLRSGGSRSCGCRKSISQRLQDRVKRLEHRIEEKIIPVPEAGCWLWTGPTSVGYGRDRDPNTRKLILLHRWMWEKYRGPIPIGMFVLHKCDVRLCCNPDHLFLGTQLDNMLDMAAKGRAPGQEKTHCPRGHEYTPENTYLHGKYGRARACRKCKPIAMREFHQRRAA